MLTKSEKVFIPIYTIIVILELICGSYDSLMQWHYFTKPAILIALIIFFWRETKSLETKTRNVTLLALVFSLLGDILLMFVNKSSHFFTSGLIAFLLAHIMYILVFSKKKNPAKKALTFILFLLIYASVFFYLLKDRLGDMLIPVAIYMIVILTMAVTAFLRHGKVNLLSYILVFLGAIFFMISDSILALNKFYQPLAFSNISIMLTYALAQILIVFGLKKQQ